MFGSGGAAKGGKMRKWLIVWALVALLAACNLNEPGPATTPTPIPPSATPLTPEPIQAQDNATDLPGVVPNATRDPNAPLPTRTPFGNLLPINPNTTPLAVATSATGERATVSLPVAGSAVIAGNLQISGVVTGLSRDEFTLMLMDDAGRVLNSQRITVQNPNRVADVPWSATMTTNTHLGAAEVRLVAQNALDQEIVLARVPITLVSSSDAAVPPPSSNTGGSVSGATVTITNPPPNGTFSGAVLTVSGTAGGLPENQFVIALIAQDGTVINSQTISLTGAQTSRVPWSAALGTNNYRGQAEIRAFPSAGSSATLASVAITIQ